MTTRYLVKKCKSMGFSVDLNNAVSLFKKSEIKNSNLLYLCNEDTEIVSKKIKYIHELPTGKKEIDEFINVNEISNSSHNIIFVQLGLKCIKNIMVPIENDETETIEENVTNEQFKSKLLSIKTNYKDFIQNIPSNAFLAQIIKIYPKLRDYKTKRALLKILNEAGTNTVQLEEANPFEFEPQDREIVVHSDIFKDIRITVDKDDVGTDSSLYKTNDSRLKKTAGGNSVSLEAFSTNQFTILKGKKSSGISNVSIKQNHDTLDTLARNGVHSTPSNERLLSFHKLVKLLKHIDSFDIVFIHPSYSSKSNRSEYPCEILEPSYIIGEGEILAIAYRFMGLKFFGYCSVISENMREYAYFI